MNGMFSGKIQNSIVKERTADIATNVKSFQLD